MLGREDFGWEDGENGADDGLVVAFHTGLSSISASAFPDETTPSAYATGSHA